MEELEGKKKKVQSRTHEPVLYVVVLGAAFLTYGVSDKGAQHTTISTVQSTVSVSGTDTSQVRDCEMRYTPVHIGVGPSTVTYHVTRDGRSFVFLATYWKLRKVDLSVDLDLRRKTRLSSFTFMALS
jgi:hypothetical protein